MRLIVDTCVWVEHYDRGNYARIEEFKARGYTVLMHDMVLGELCMGVPPTSHQMFFRLETLRRIRNVGADKVRQFVREHHLGGTGLQWVDANLLCSAYTYNATLYTFDKRLAKAAQALTVAA